jgi:hypothetical protein
MSLRSLATSLNKQPDLRIQGLLKKRTETVEEFLTKFFNDWNKEKNTLDVESGNVQTQPNKRRSFGDIYKIVKYYYPDTPLRVVRDFLFKDGFESISRFRSSMCSQINKRVWYVGNNTQPSEIYNKSEEDEFGMTWKQWKEEE